MSPARRVVVVTGSAVGIGAAIAEALGRTGAHVVTLDANVSLDGSPASSVDGPTTADRIVASGGTAEAVQLSVTDGPGVAALFDRLVSDHGRLDAVVNVAGISRPTSFAAGSEDDWRAVIDVHLGGWLTILDAALPIMAGAGHGRLVGVTSGSGWRPADAGAYACAKRAVASLTWQLGPMAPPGVTINALSPIAATRMVTAGLQRSRGGDSSRRAATGGISLAGFPDPAALGPVGAHLAGDTLGWCSGEVLFSAGAEVALIGRPRILESIRSRPVDDRARTLARVVPEAFVPAEVAQATGGGGLARFIDAFEATSGGESPGAEPPRGNGVRCLVVGFDGASTDGLVTTLTARGVVSAVTVGDSGHSAPFVAAAEAVAAAAADLGGLDVLVTTTPATVTADRAAVPWQNALEDHHGLPGRIVADAAWMRAFADHCAVDEQPGRIVALLGAASPGGRSRAQAATQLSRAASGATEQRVAAVVVSLESALDEDLDAAHELVAHLAVGTDTAALSGAELAVGEGWIALRSHPGPLGTVNFGGPELPADFDGALAALVQGTTP